MVGNREFSTRADYQSEVSEVVGLSTKSVMHDLSKNEIREERDAAKDARRNLSSVQAIYN
jgi:hypothetical protein